MKQRCFSSKIIKDDVKAMNVYVDTLKYGAGRGGAGRKISQARTFRFMYKYSFPGGTLWQVITVFISLMPGRVAQSVGHLTHKSGVLGSIPGLVTYFRFSFRFFKKGSCQLLAKVCVRSTD